MGGYAKAGIAELIETLRNRWTQQGLTLRPGLTVQQIGSFENRYKIKLPEDLRQFYLAVDGMEEGQADDDFFSFLRLQAVKTIPEELARFSGIPDYTEITSTLAEPERWFVIVEYMIFSAAYAISLSARAEENAVLCILDGKQHRVVAPSFVGFVREYLENPMKLL
ncbi:MAG: SMI1/KNR4 family protein [Singulisphaera sp.]